MADLDPVAELRARALKSNISFQAVCKRAGVALSTAFRWEKGTFEPKVKTLRKLSDALDELIKERRRPPDVSASTAEAA